MSDTNLIDMAELSATIKKSIQQFAGPALEDAIKPIVEKSDELGGYADQLVELERRKQELPGAGDPRRKGCEFARRVRLVGLGQGDLQRGVFEAKRHWGADDPTVRAVEKSLTSSNPTSAGALIPPAVAAEIIELRRNATVVRRVARVIPMPNGAISIRKHTGASTAQWVGESVNTTTSEQTVGLLNFNFKKLRAITPVSNSLLRQGGMEADALVRDDLLASAAQKEDVSFLYSTGSESTPVGILHRMSSSNSFAQTGTALEDRWNDLSDAVALLDGANVPDGERYFYISPRLFWSLYKTQAVIGSDPTGFPFAKGLEQMPPRLMSYEVLKSKQVDQTGDDEFATRHDAFVVHGPSLIIADGYGPEVEAFPGGAYHDGSNVVSGVSRDETPITLTYEVDFNLRHDDAVAHISGITIP